jgi:hypothetical protein
MRLAAAIGPQKPMNRRMAMREIILATVTLIVLTVASSAVSLRTQSLARCTAYAPYAHCVGHHWQS